MASETKTCWVISEDKAGMLAQAEGLATAIKHALNEFAEVSGKKIIFENQTCLIEGVFPWQHLPNLFWPKGKFNVKRVDGQNFQAPWPDLVISSGRKAAPVARDVKLHAAKASKSCFALHIQRPAMPVSEFDLVTCPVHDQLSGDNVVETLGSLGRLTSAKLEEAALKWAPDFNYLPTPLTAVSIGGDSKVYQYTSDDMVRLAEGLRYLYKAKGGSFLITASRRTSLENMEIFKNHIKDLPHYLWDGGGNNPYFGFLGLADHLVVTCDSANMVSEACSTGKPVYVFHVKPSRQTKFDLFHKALEEKGYTRSLSGPSSDPIEDWRYDPLRETELVARIVIQRWLGIGATVDD